VTELISVGALITTSVVLVVYSVSVWLFRKSDYFPLVHPLAVGSLILAGFIALTYDNFGEFRRDSWLFYWLLGPATVALALPLYHERSKIREAVTPVMTGIAAGALISPLVALALSWLSGGEDIISSIATKSVTTPIALGISEKTGGIPGLVAGVVIFTGVVGALTGPTLLKLLGIRDERILGLVLGVNAHGVGTASAFQISPRCGAFASLAMGITGTLTALVLPVIHNLL
jgi:putative effector of murein hydrolase